jgi:hypothetical protein
LAALMMTPTIRTPILSSGIWRFNATDVVNGGHCRLRGQQEWSAALFGLRQCRSSGFASMGRRMR